MLIVPHFKVTPQYMKDRPDFIYVHDENLFQKSLCKRWNKVSNKYGFLTHYNVDIKFHRSKKGGTWATKTHEVFKLGYYMDLIYHIEEALLVNMIEKTQDKVFLIDKLGFAGQLNSHGFVFDQAIKPRLSKALEKFNNVELLWE